MPLDQFTAYFSSWNNIFALFRGKEELRKPKNAFLARFQLPLFGGQFLTRKLGKNDIFGQNVGGKPV